MTLHRCAECGKRICAVSGSTCALCHHKQRVDLNAWRPRVDHAETIANEWPYLDIVEAFENAARVHERSGTPHIPVEVLRRAMMLAYAARGDRG